MDEHTMITTGYELCNLVSVALRGEQVSQVKNPELIYKMASRHSLSVLAAAALPQISDEWQKHNSILAGRFMLMDFEREEVYSFLREQHLWYLPMKGLVLRNLYPEPTYREMCDNDIFFDDKGAKIVKEWFVNRGYDVEDNEKYGVDLVPDDAYHKKPCFNFEMHKRFFSVDHENWVDYYSDMDKFLIPVDEYERKLSDEDFYVYFTLHGYKHYSNCGIGLRAVVDTYVYTTTKKLNWDYINAELDKLGIIQFERDMRTLGQKLFNGVPLESEEENMFMYILSSGSYGTQRHHLEKQLQGQTKLHYMWKRLFPGREWVQKAVPFYKEYVWLIPCYYVYRFFNRTFRNGKNIRSEIKCIGTIKQ